MSDYEQKIEKAIIHTAEKGDVPQLLVFSTGVVLRVKMFPVLLIQDVLLQFKYPDVPEMWDKERERFIKNPDSQIYQELKQTVDFERNKALVDTIVAFGTEIESIPEGVPAPSDNIWIENLKLVNVFVREDNELARYQAWVKFVAAPKGEDLAQISNLFNQQLGISEVKIAAAARENFPS